MSESTKIHTAFEMASEQYAALGVDVNAALKRLAEIAISVHCWQGDDVAGFEGTAGALGNGLAVTGNYPGRARSVDELRSDLELAYSLIPGKQRLNLHALYGEFNGLVDRTEMDVEHFQGWIDWSRSQAVDLDFNPSYFSHPKAADGFTLAHADVGIRQFWIEHGIACRKIAAAMGAAQGNACMNNFWIPDGYKDTPADRRAPRERLIDSLDQIFAQAWPREQTLVFAWLCNGAMHFGMADLSIFRFARSPAAGWAPAIGMFLGHYMAWICAALLLAALIKLQPSLAVGSDGRVAANPGILTFASLGWTGILCVVIAGWTTANPTIYRAGLAFQGIVPNSSRTAMTLVAGAVATIAGAFPNLSAQLLGFVGTYGTVLGPMGAVIFVDYHLMKKLGLQDEYAAAHGTQINVAVLVAWLLPVAVGLYLILQHGLFAAYAVVPCWVVCGALYLVLSKFTQAQPLPVASAQL